METVFLQMAAGNANGSDVWCLRWTFLDGFICLVAVANELIPSRSCGPPSSTRKKVRGPGRKFEGLRTQPLLMRAEPCGRAVALRDASLSGRRSHVITGVLVLAVSVNAARLFAE